MDADIATPAPTPRPLPLFLTDACPSCGYSLLGLPESGACPECGWAFGADTLMIRGRELPRARAGCGALIIAVIASGVIAVTVAVGTKLFIVGAVLVFVGLLIGQWMSETRRKRGARLFLDPAGYRQVYRPRPGNYDSWPPPGRIRMEFCGSGLASLTIEASDDEWSLELRPPIQFGFECTLNDFQTIQRRILKWSAASVQKEG